MIRKILGRLSAARSFVFAALALASFAASAFDTPYLTFRSAETFSIQINAKKWDGTIEYSTDTLNWATWDGTTTINAALSGDEYFLYLRGTGNTVVNAGNYRGFALTGTDISCEGDIETLRDYNGNPPAMGTQCYEYLFKGCASLVRAPFLSATVLADSCYYNMFQDCTALTEVPDFPIATMAASCCSGMFKGCSSLSTPPMLPSTSSADSCYAYMFQNCTSLTSLPALPATTTESTCYFYMFDGCTSLVVNSSGEGVEWSLPIMVKTGSIYNWHMFDNTGGDFTGRPEPGTTYYVASALPPGLSLIAGTDELAAYTGESINFNLSETVKGGVPSYTFSGTVPTGLTLNPNGTLSGSVATAGSYPFTLRVTDATSPDPLTLDAEYTLVVSDPEPLAVTQANLGSVKVGKEKSFTLADTISGGVPTYTFDFNGAHDAAFSLSAGVLTFTPTAAQNYSCAITVTDALGSTLPVTYTVVAVESAGFTDDDPEEPETGDVVDCLTPDGVFPRTCHQVTSSSTAVTWTDSWYYVAPNATVTLSAGAIVSGKVSLILGDGATLTVQVSSGNAGIKVTEGNALTIYAQSNGAAAGVMTVTSGMYGAGIGGIESVNSGTVNIYGGNITATGNSRSAGIGGGRYAHNGKVVIAGGIVNATGGFGGAGIGGGDTGNGGIVNIDGGDVHAVGGWYAAGIGGGYNGTGGSVTVRGGSVSAIGYDSNTPGIGAYASNQGELTVGANIVVKAGSSATLTDADIKNPNGETSIPLTTKYRYYSFETTGPVPLAQKPGAGALAALVGGEASWTLSDTIAGGEAPYSFEPKSGYEPPAFLTLANGVLSGIPTAAGSWTFTLVVTDSNSDSIEAEYTLTVSAPAALSANGALGNIVKNAAANYNLSTTVSGGIPGYTFALKAGSTLPDGLILENGVISGSPTTAGNYAFTIVVSDSALPTANTIEAEYTLSVKEIYNIVYKNREGTGNLSLVPSTYVEGTGVATLPTPTVAGWVFVSWHYNSNLQDDPVTSIPANATGDKTLYSKWEENLSGIVPMTFIDIDGSSLTTNCTVIDSTTTTLASGWYTVANDITFSSKTLTVAGDVKIVLRDGKTMTITSGENNKAGVSVADGYSLSIYGQSAGTGTLNTKGNWYGAGIGGNTGVKGGTVTINGGTVIATAGKDAAGIGGGLGADGGTVVINGGNVTVTSNNDGAGIGGGKNGTGGTLTVNGGSVSVQGYQYGSTSPGVGGGVGATQHGKLYVGDYVSVMAGNRSNQMSERTPDANGEIALAGEIFFSFASTKPVSVSYLDTDGVVKYVNCVIIASGTVQLSNGWYAATSSVNIPSGLTVLDDVKLIIADGATVTVTAGTAYGKAGISVGAGNSLTVYSQEAGTGVLNATGYDSGAGIGGNNGVACGSVTINGCTVNATGGSSGAGIGGGYTGAGGIIVVNGGEVHATGGGSNTPGIGGGFGSNIVQGSLTVGGNMVVKAGSSSTLTDADIKNPGGETSIPLTTAYQYYRVEKYRPASLAQMMDALAAYVGEAFNKALSATVSGGTPSYTFVKKSGTLPAGLEFNDGVISGTPSAPTSETVVFTVTDSGAPAQSEDFTYTITVTLPPKSITYIDSRDGTTELTGLEPAQYTPGTATPLPVTATAPTGYTFAGWYPTAECTGDAVTAVPASETENKTYYAKWTPIVYTVTYMTDSTTPITDQGLMPTNYTIESATLDLPATATKAGKGFYGWHDNPACSGDAISTIPHGSTGNKVFYAKWGAVRSNEGYVDANGNAMPEQLCTVIASDTTTLETGWYVAKGEVTITEAVTVSGNVNLILADGAMLTVTQSVNSTAGINVSGGNSLTIYAQSHGTSAGRLIATGADQGAGIGGGRKQSAGLVTVYGGNITANGGFAAAGIGGGDEGSGGTLTVHAGNVTATGQATGIGGGNGGNGATVVVYGGTVTATSGGVLSPGIGGGYGSSDPGKLRVGAHVVVKAGTRTPPTTELPHGASDELGYAIELESSRYYVITTKEPDPLTQATSTLVAFVNEAAAIDLAETVAGGTPDYTFALKTGTMPSGLELVGTTLTGTPTVKGPSTLVFTVSDSADKNEEFTYTLLVADPPQPITYIDGHDGTTQLTGLTPTNYVEGIGATLPATKSKLGYNLDGWYDNAGLAGDPVTTIGTDATGPQTFYAKWKTVAYRITYKDGSTTMTGLVPTNYTIESGATLPATATKDGYGFYGWYTNSSFTGSVITGLPVGTYGNKTFYAKWGDPKVPADYVDIDGVLKTAEECLEISSTTKTLETGWYVVKKSTPIDSTVTVSGDVKLILADGVTLTVNGTAYKAGINVTGDNSLTIYAQENGTGALIVTGGSDSAGIGGNRQQSCGTVTIVGGNVTARAYGSSLEGAGIGGGSRGDGGTVTIYGGTVVAQTQYASSYGAGIGGGGGTSTAAGNGGTVTIYGGNVTATATCKGAGIGGGYYGNGGTVTIYGGTVVATSGESGAGIGGGMSGNGGNVTIEGGFVTATAGSKSDLASNVATGIGKGYGNPATYTKGTLTVGENMAAYADFTENPTVKLGSGSITIGTQRYFVVRADDLSQTKGEFFLNVGEVCNIDLSETVKGGGGNYTFALKDGSSLPSQLSIVGGNVLTGTVAVADIYNFTLTVTDPMLPTPLYADYTMTVRPAGFIPDDPEEPVSGDTVDCRTADGEVRSRTCQQVESSDVAVVWSDSWYYVTNNVTLNAGVTVNGNVSLILCDGAMLTVRGATANDPGIKLIRTDSATNTLVIYGLSVGDGAGALTAIGGTHAPGIGTSKENNDSLERFGRLIVNGGVVTASCNEGSGDYGAGIGTSYRQTGDGSLTVNGGSVTAIGGSEAAGIGGGPGGSVYVARGGYGFDVTVNGGTVVATGGEEGAGIGGGHYGNGGTLTVNGGTVTATGGYYAAGIGGGRGVGSGDGGHGGVVHIYGGTVTAKTLYTGEGSDVPTGIGQGYAGCSHPGDLFVYDGVIVNAGSREDLTQKQLPDENHEVRILASHRYFYIETLEIVPRLVNIAPILDSVDKNDRYFSRLLANNINGGWGQLHFAMDDGAELPAGLELDDSGRLAGTPTQAGTFEIHVVVTDSSEPCMMLQTTFTLKVNESYGIMYYDSDGTTRVYPQPVINSYFEGTGVDELPVPAKTGYVFAGWYEDKDDMTGDSIISISAEATGDKTFYAKWTPVQYSITYIDASEQGGQHPEGEEIYGLEPSSYTIESGATLPTSAVKEGYMLLGWYADKWFNGSSITAIPVGEHEDKTFYAKWFELGHPLELADGEIEADAGEEINLNLKDTITGGTVTYSFALKEEAGNELPAGFELDSDGTLSGSVASAGSYTFKVMVTDSTEPQANVIEAVYTLQVNFAKSTSDPQGLDAKFYIGLPSSINLASAISGGTAPYSFSLVPEEGSLPDGMAINGNKLEGTPTMVGNSHFCLRVTDDNGVVSDLYYWTYVQSNNINQYYSINGINWGWVHSAPPKSDGCLSIWGGGTNAIPAGTVGSVYVPSHIGNISDPITCIGSAAFSNCTAVTRVTLPETIIDIGVNAFAGCTSLTSLVIRANVAHINAGAFSGCSNLGVVYVDQGDADRVRALVAASGCDVSGIAFVESDFYSLTLDTNLGDELDMSVLTKPYTETLYLPNVGNLPVPTRKDYTFEGWYTERSGGTRINEDDTLSGGDWTLYAHWSTTMPDPVFTVNWKGEITDVALNGHTEVVVPETVNDITVTAIGDRAFDGRTATAKKKLLRVALPDTIKNIGSSAFAECTNLREVNIPAGVTNIALQAFRLCVSLDSVDIPGSVETIGSSAFANCSNLVSVTINNGVNSIGQSAFANCTSLSCDDEQGFYIPDSVESIGNGAFHGIAFTKASLPGSLYSDGSPVSAAFMNVNLLKSVDVTYRTDHPTFVIHSGRLTRVYLNGNTEVVVPDGVTEIWSAAFNGLSAMTSVTIPDTVTIIRVGAFSDCTGLTEIDLPDSLLYLESAFRGCTNLKHIVIPDSVAEISEGCFASCDFLESVTIGSGVTRIPFSAFAYCSSLTNVTIRGNVTSIGRVAFSGCSSLPAIELPNSLNVIDGSAFYNCASLASVRIPKGVDVGSFAFARCSSLKSANVGGTAVTRLMMSAKGGRRLLAAPPEDATKLGSYAFSGCSELENATIGSTVDEIGGGAFGGCSKLKSITVESGNENYETVGGMLLSADGKVLISGAGDATNITVPNGVTNILEGAFAGFTSITNVTLPNTVRIVGEAAFSNSTALATMTIPASVTTIGVNAFCDTVLATVYVAKGDTERVQALVVGTGYAGTVAYVELQDEESKPSIPGDSAATVTGDAENGYTVVPSTTTGTVEVEIPAGLDAGKVTVEVPPTASVKPNGANVAVVRTVDATSYDITAFLDIPAADANGVINLGDATVKDAIIEEVLDPEKGAELELTPDDPSITTAETRAGLTYTFYEGTALQNMTPKATKVGDGNAWTPTITVKGGTSGFYSVHVTK